MFSTKSYTRFVAVIAISFASLSSAHAAPSDASASGFMSHAPAWVVYFVNFTRLYGADSQQRLAN